MTTRLSRITAGQRFGRLVVVAEAPGNGLNRRWECRCDCGATKLAYQPNLRSGRVQSCGCLRATRRYRIFQDGYAFVTAPEHPRANPRTGRVREHILVMEQVLGRPLAVGEEVHHRNGDRGDNRPENLELWNRSQPAGVRVEDQVEWAKQILMRYEPAGLVT